MRKARIAAMVAIALVLLASAVIYSTDRSGSPAALVGVVRATEVRVEPEVNGQLVSIAVRKGAHVRAGDVLARLSAVELTAQLDQAHAALASAVASRNNVYAGVRREQVDSLKAAIAKASSRLNYVQAQLTRTSTLARQNFESQQALDQAENDVAGARADVAGAQANYDAAVAGPTKEERAIADAQVQAAAAAVAVLERRLDKMILRAPADGVVSVIAAEVGENVRAGQPILMVEAAGKQWLSFNVREDHLGGLAMGDTVNVKRNGADGTIKSVITELRPLGVFATWQAERVIGDHDRNTLRLRLDAQQVPAGLEPGMTAGSSANGKRLTIPPQIAHEAKASFTRWPQAHRIDVWRARSLATSLIGRVLPSGAASEETVTTGPSVAPTASAICKRLQRQCCCGRPAPGQSYVNFRRNGRTEQQKSSSRGDL
ncbi:HlyD family secretion protein [Bradyrhizobium lablabi]|uniref:HlyD family secretion protein n=1 Tax=Bradyrhizobium lablabi TaxID=722472 RepID=UPI002011C1BA|nr:biotin/lipoyl-binding protein [Bradyrhizobium lablabi]